MEIRKVGVKLGFYSPVLPFLKVAVLLFQGRLEKYLLTFGKNEILCYKSCKHSSAAFLFFLQESEKTEIYQVKMRFNRIFDN